MRREIPSVGNPDFDWSLYEDGYNGANLMPNKKIKVNDKHIKVYSHESYAEALFKQYVDRNAVVYPKDEIIGSLMPVVNIHPASDNSVMVDTLGSGTIHIDMNKEKELVRSFGYTNTADFIDAMRNPLNKKIFLETHPVVKVVSKGRQSLWEGHVEMLKEEFKQQLKNPTTAYMAKLLSTNNGGYMCDVQGVKCFMPGSMAAAGIIRDFQSLVGTSVPVMIENYVENYGYVVSYKRYLQKVLPTKVAEELEINQLHMCTITGFSGNGIFVSFPDIHNNQVFIGLIHRNEMSLEFEKQFDNGEFHEDDVIMAYIHTIENDGQKVRIVLGDCDMNSFDYATRSWMNEEQEKYNQMVERVGAPSYQKKAFAPKKRKHQKEETAKQ